jgi:hypothetical protein
MENKIIPTAEELIKNIVQFESSIDVIPIYSLNKIMIEFAKLHVEAALKQAAYESQCYNKPKFKGDENWVVDMESILNSYPLDKIK